MGRPKGSNCKKKTSAIEMRKQGIAIPKIAKELHVSKGTISRWVREVILTPEQKEAINSVRFGRKMPDSVRKKLSDSLKKTWKQKRAGLEDNQGICTICHRIIDRSKLRKGRITGYCVDCRKEYERTRWQSLRKEAMNKLGGAICAECGCDVLEILEINHIDGGGYIERKQGRGNSAKRLLMNIIHNKCDLTKYNVLCRVCNTHHYVEKIRGVSGHTIKWQSVRDVIG